MKRTRKSNRVSWATGRDLCQVKLFSSDEHPAKVGQVFQDHRQTNTPLMLHSTINESIDLPPGFERNYFLNQPTVKFSHISKIKWECPPLFALSSHWRVAAGEESMEKEVQKLREMRVLEAFYPRISNIPPSPSVSFCAEEEDYNDNNTPLIPIIPIEEQESMSNNIFPELAASQNLHQYSSTTSSISSNCNTSCTVSSDACAKPLAPVVSHALDANLGTTSTVEAAITNINEQVNLIDMDLLIKILNDPIMIEQLLSQQRMAATTASASSNAFLSTPTPDEAASGSTLRRTVGLLPHGLRPAPFTSIPSSELSTVSLTHASGNLHTVVNWAQTTANTLPYQPNTGSSYAIENGNNYKNLIGEYGGDKQVNMESMKSVHHKQGEVKYKIQKPCRYFKSKRGCRNGNNCLYKHDVYVQMGAGNVSRDQNAKKLKL